MRPRGSHERGELDVDPDLADRLADLVDRIEAGEVVEPEALIRQHPDCADDLRRLLQTINLLADVGSASSSGKAGVALAELDEADWPTGRRELFGDFRLICEIGRGGMGVVYEAEQIS